MTRTSQSNVHSRTGLAHVKPHKVAEIFGLCARRQRVDTKSECPHASLKDACQSATQEMA